jgi:serine/threonine-protein kinase RsbW
MDACHPQHELGDADFTRTVAAAPAAVSDLTRQIGDWLNDTVSIDTQRHSDILLATYEALANCADHAYRHHHDTGMMTIEATFDAPTTTVRVCVTDRGRWIDPNTTTMNNTRGRGLRLMQALCDDFTVNGTDDGTTVCLHFENCSATSKPSHHNIGEQRSNATDPSPTARAFESS